MGRVGMGNGSFTRGHGGTGQRARGAWGCASVGLGADRHRTGKQPQGGRATPLEETRHGGETTFLSMQEEAIS